MPIWIIEYQRLLMNYYVNYGIIVKLLGMRIALWSLKKVMIC